MADGKEMAEFAEALWENYLKDKASELMKNQIFGFRAVVSANPGGGKLRVQRPFDSTTLTLRCPASMASTTIGTQVLCLAIGTLSNAFILCKADLSNL